MGKRAADFTLVMRPGLERELDLASVERRRRSIHPAVTRDASVLHVVDAVRLECCPPAAMETAPGEVNGESSRRCEQMTTMTVEGCLRFV